MNRILQSGRLMYRIGDKYYEVGEIRKELTSEMATVYTIEIYKDKFDPLKALDPSICSISLPGMDLDDGYKQTWNKVPYFVYKRVADSRRGDIDEILARYGMQYYDAFTLLLRNKGRQLDQWEVWENK